MGAGKSARPLWLILDGQTSVDNPRSGRDQENEMDMEPIPAKSACQCSPGETSTLA